MIQRKNIFARKSRHIDIPLTDFLFIKKKKKNFLFKNQNKSLVKKKKIKTNLNIKLAC
jgi:hypothetical protein